MRQPLLGILKLSLQSIGVSIYLLPGLFIMSILFCFPHAMYLSNKFLLLFTPLLHFEILTHIVPNLKKRLRHVLNIIRRRLVGGKWEATEERYLNIESINNSSKFWLSQVTLIAN